MKINLLIAASFLALGALLTSPLHAMEDFDKENKGKGGNTRQIRSEISTRLFLEVPKSSEVDNSQTLKLRRTYSTENSSGTI